jgi:predicted enzyme related to lactoylglutathione lyase
MSDHKVIHIEISAQNLNDAGKFYTDLFGWEVTHFPEMNYATTNDAGVGFGLNLVTKESPAGMITFYVYTDDVTATLDKAVSLGAELVVPKTEIPTVGWFGAFRDPTGNLISLLTPIPPQ